MGDQGPEPEQSELPPEEELALLARELRAYVAWQADCGTDGLPRDPELPRKLEQLKREYQEAMRAAPREAPAAAASKAPVRNPRETKAAEADGAPASAAPRKAERPPADRGAPPAGDAPPRAAVPPMSRVSLELLGSSLDELQTTVAACTKCSLHESRTQTVFSRGSGSCGLCFVGEGPGADEDAQGAPFVGKAGQLLDQMIGAMGLDREEVYVCNIVKCRPPNNRKPNETEMAACGDYLARQLELLKPEVLVALGGTAVEGLLGMRQGITKIRGKFRLYDGRIAVMPTFHPAYLLRNPRAKREVWADLQQVLQYMGRELPAKS